MMKKNEEITRLSKQILDELSKSKLDLLPSILLKAFRLSTLLLLTPQANTFKNWAKDAEYKIFEINAYESDISSAKDPDISLTSANPNQIVGLGYHGNGIERSAIRNQARTARSALAAYSTETYDFALNIYTKWQFGNIAETIFESKRVRTDKVLSAILPDSKDRLRSIENNISSDKTEDWKSAVGSCRALLMDLADILMPPKTHGDKQKYKNRLKTFVSSLPSETKKKIVRTTLDELKTRIEYTIDYVQGPAHQDRPTKEQAESAVLYTYLVVAELLEIYSNRQPKIKEQAINRITAT